MFSNGTSPNTSYRVSRVDKPRRADLWCLEVEKDQTFVLDNGIVTGNCAYHPLEDPFAFAELLYILMQGTGSGFSVESDYVDELPRIKKQRGKKPEVIVVPDDTEGWCDSFHKSLLRLWDGYDVEYDTHLVRKENSRLKTKGGRASGPGPLLELLSFTRNMFLSRQGRYLEDTDAHRLACFAGRITQVGGVRRAAGISLSELMSRGMRLIKNGPWYTDKTYWTDGKYLTMANNSAVYSERPPVDVFMEEWLALVQSHSGERGIFNREAVLKHRPKRRKAAKFGCNPCAEINLRPYQFCNLSIAVARPWDTAETLKRKVRLATVFGVIQSTCTRFNYIRDQWKKNCEEERLLGVDITGHADCPLLQCGAPGRAQLLEVLKAEVHATKKKYAARFGINESTADTCIKPGGDSGVFFDCGSGISDRYSDQQIRWVRERKDSPVAQFLVDSGVPYATAPENDSLLVFGFPRESPKGSTTRNKHSAIEQCEMWLETTKHWAEHSVSTTIHVEEDEWLELGAWVYEREHWDQLKGVCFQPKDNGSYTYAPNEELSPEKFAEFKGNFPSLNWAKLTHYEDEDMTGATQTLACTGRGCES
jgi:ribonucleoside-triphosphate reductase (thioredoxin)